MKHPLAKEGSFEMHGKHSGKFAKKSLAPFHVEGAPMFHFSIVPPKPVSLGDSSTAAEPERGSFKINDGGVIGKFNFVNVVWINTIIQPSAEEDSRNSGTIY